MDFPARLGYTLPLYNDVLAEVNVQQSLARVTLEVREYGIYKIWPFASTKDEYHHFEHSSQVTYNGGCNKKARTAKGRDCFFTNGLFNFGVQTGYF